MKTRADEMLGPVSGNEYDLLLSKLAGARDNRVFSFFGIEAPQRAAEALLAIQKAGGDGNPVTTSSPPIAARRIAAVAPPPKPSLALEYSAMEPDSDDELVQEIQSVLATTEPHAKNSAAAPSSPSSSSTSSDSSSFSSGEDVEGSGPGPQGHATAPETARGVHLDREQRLPRKHLRPY